LIEITYNKAIDFEENIIRTKYYGVPPTITDTERAPILFAEGGIKHSFSFSEINKEY